ncbi:MAG: BREX-4 system phosphatase PglZ [Clostridia bacterium]|nr:BREX-4 system phosphatase PglZ [Clostridia bacterium]
MEKFNSLLALQTYLRKDRTENCLNPVRFINVESMEMWVEVKKLLFSMSSGHLFLSDFCDGEDTTPNIRRLIARMKATADSICVLPISEYLRINPEIAKSTICDILTKEYPEAQHNPLFRIYVPMYRMHSILHTLPDNDPRRKGSILLLKTGEEIDYSLTIIQEGLDVEVSGNEIYGFKKYLRYWEQNPDKPLILHTSNAVYFENNVFFDDVKVIVTSFDLMRFHYSLPSQFRLADGKESDWNKLAQIVAKEKTFEDACCSELSINRYNTKLFEHWKTYTCFQKWLLWMWTRIQPNSGYLIEAAKGASSPEGFIESLFCNIISLVDSNSFAEIYLQRKALLAKLNLQVPQAFWDAIKNANALDALSVITDLTAKEREFVFSVLQGWDYTKKAEVMAILRTVYPALANYLQFDGELETGDFSDVHEEYFGKYRWYKATNGLPEEFVDTVRSIAEEKGARVFTLKARNYVVNEEYDANTTILFVDGMGAEYIDYIAYVLAEMPIDKFGISYRAGYCNLPSTTENNKDFLSGKNVVLEMLDLDELKHGSNKYPNNIIQELAFLDTLREKIENAFSSERTKVILTSDHGTSRLAVLIRKTELDRKIPAQGHAIYKYGRYCEGTDIADKLPTTIEYDGKLIFADYTRFEQKGAPIDEIHGGAALEEWLVPVITIEKKSGRAKKTIINKAFLKEDEYKIDSFTKMVTVVFGLKNPVTDAVFVIVRGKRISCEKYDDEYTFKYRPFDGETETTATVFCGNHDIGKIKFAVKRPLDANKKFDI